MQKIIETPLRGGMDYAYAEFGGKHYDFRGRHGAAMEVARKLVRAGAEDGPCEIVDADGAVRLHGPPLHKLAALTIEERDMKGPRLGKYEINPRFGHPAHAAREPRILQSDFERLRAP